MNTKRIGETKKKIEYTAEYKVQRSDTLLTYLLKRQSTSRNNVKKLLSSHLVTVNGKSVSQFDFPLAKDDEVKILKHFVEFQKEERRDEKRGADKKRVKKAPIRVLYEDDDFIAVDKPEGLLSVESDKETESCYAYVYEYLKEKGKNVRPYVLHRIDKETSGVLVFAKNIKVHSKLKLEWNEHVSLREYIAVVKGRFEQKEGTIVSYLKENRNNMMYVSFDKTGQRAVTKYTVLKETKDYSLLRVEIETGRKNQIRVQMAYLNHPVLGDDKYGDGKEKADRLYLHASKLMLAHPFTKEEKLFSSKTPSAFLQLFSKER